MLVLVLAELKPAVDIQRNALLILTQEEPCEIHSLRPVRAEVLMLQFKGHSTHLHTALTEVSIILK